MDDMLDFERPDEDYRAALINAQSMITGGQSLLDETSMMQQQEEPTEEEVKRAVIEKLVNIKDASEVLQTKIQLNNKRAKK